jgi:antitoxin ParD1/3/4
MHISLTPELENAVKEKVASGLYNEVICEALRQAIMGEQENQWIARAAAIGIAQLNAGQSVEVESEQQFVDLIRGEG